MDNVTAIGRTILPAKAPTPRIHLITLLLATFLVLMAGLMRMLPLLPDTDEPIFVESAMRIAASGNLDPGFYGNPGTTLIYPLALGAHLWHAATQQGMLLRPDPNLAADFAATPWHYYYLSRLLTVAYGLLGVVFTALVGKRAFGRRASGWRIGLAAGWFFALGPLVVMHARLVRTDSAATAFGMLALYLILRLLDAPSWRLHLAAGVAIGLAIAARYFMVALVAPLLAVDLLLYLRSRTLGAQPFAWQGAFLGLLSVPVIFLLSVPTLLPNFAKVVTDLRTEARSTHMGADGLSFFGNLRWYATTGLVQSVQWPLAIAVWAGIILLVVERALRPLLLLLFALTFLVGVSLSPLHWHRWIIPILPVLMLAAAVTLDRLATWAARRSPRLATAYFGVGVLLLLAWPLGKTILMDVRDAGPNTRLEARAWMAAHLPPASRLLQESYGAPLDNLSFRAEAIRSLADTGDLSALRNLGYDYVVASSAIYDRIFAEPERYPDEIAFYNQLFATSALVKEFDPAWYESGPVIRIYAP